MPDERLLLIVELFSVPIGVVRFDRRETSSAEISAYVLPPYTGKGHGVAAIGKACSQVLAQWPLDRIVACVRDDNPVAVKGFSRAGFTHGPSECPAEHHTLILTR